MKGAYLFLMVLVVIESQQNKAILAISWFGGFCQFVKDCRAQALDAWDHQSFTIHGYWPDKSSSYDYGDFDITLFNRSLLADMNNYWPPHSRRTHQPYFLWQHEFKDHGSDFSDIYYAQHKKDFVGLTETQENNKLQSIYFDSVIKLYKSLNLQKIPNSTYSKADFANLLGLKQNQFSLVCNQGSATLQQIRICYDIRPSGSVVVQCTKVTSKNCKDNQIVLGSWKQSKANAPVTRV